VNRDLPMASEARKERKLQREQFKKSLEQEFSEKRKFTVDKVCLCLPSKIEVHLTFFMGMMPVSVQNAFDCNIFLSFCALH